MNPSAIAYQFFDGSGNRYTISPTELNFDPVQPTESSSGVYSGGKPAIIPLKSAQFLTLSDLLEKGIHQTTSHLNDRIKRSGVITKTSQSTSVSVILSPDSPELRVVEDALRAFLV
jgi:hypothetical protein